MNEALPIFPGARACVGCGFCCKQGPCPYGEWSFERGQCQFLTDANRCGIYDQIIASPVDEWRIAPAFGSGCCSPFNSDRHGMLARDNQGLGRHVDGSTGPYPQRGRGGLGHDERGTDGRRSRGKPGGVAARSEMREGLLET